MRALAEDKGGNIWAGMMAGGLDRISPETGAITHFKHDPRDPTSIGNDNVALWVDHSGALWVGFQGGGVDTLPTPATGGAFTHFRERDGLASDEVTAIVEDRAPGNVWIATGRGLSRLDPDRRTFHTFGADAGLPSAPFTRARSQCKVADCCSARSAAIELDARGLQDDPTAPPIALTDFLLANEHVVPNSNGPLRQPINVTDTVQLNWDQRVVSIQFAALSYRVPTLNRYRYMLEGVRPPVDRSRQQPTTGHLYQPGPRHVRLRVTGSTRRRVECGPDAR